MNEPWGMLDEAELPERYGTDRVHAMARDPKMLFVYWELTEEGHASAAGRLPAAARALGAPRNALRLSALAGPATGAAQTVDGGTLATGAAARELIVLIDSDLGSAYIEWPAGGWVRTELGVVAGGHFVALCASPATAMPPAMPDATAATRVQGSPWRRRELL